MSRTSRMAIHCIPLLNPGNSYPHIGHTLLSASTSIAHEGHSFFFILLLRFHKDNKAGFKSASHAHALY